MTTKKEHNWISFPPFPCMRQVIKFQLAKVAAREMDGWDVILGMEKGKELSIFDFLDFYAWNWDSQNVFKINSSSFPFLLFAPSSAKCSLHPRCEQKEEKADRWPLWWLLHFPHKKIGGLSPFSHFFSSWVSESWVFVRTINNGEIYIGIEWSGEGKKKRKINVAHSSDSPCKRRAHLSPSKSPMRFPK